MQPSLTPAQLRFLGGQFIPDARSAVAAPGLGAQGTSLTLTAGDGEDFPQIGPYPILLGSDAADQFEVAQVTMVAGDTLTLARGAWARGWAIGTPVRALMPEGLRDLWRLAAALSLIATPQRVVLEADLAQPLAAVGGTVAVARLAVSRVNPSAGAATGAILVAGKTDGQQIIVENDHATNSVTFDVAGTSNVADGTGDVIAPLSSAIFIWNAAAALWFRAR